MNKYQDYINNQDINLIDSISNFKKELSKKTIKKYIKHKMVMVNNKIITNCNFKLKIGDKIKIIYDKNLSDNYNLNILYEDEYLIIINKPSGLLSISNDKEKNNTAYRMVSDYVKINNKKNYIFVVHRLDQDTSGILMFCKNQKIRDKMQENWNNLIKKRGYIALVEGILNGSGTYHSYLVEDKRQFVHSSKSHYGKEAITHYEVIKEGNNCTLAQVFIDTGRRNQIRVHFSEHHHPIVGDKKYRCTTNPIKRLCLHANILEFIHPVEKKLIHIECKYPQEFDKILNK